MQSGLFQKKYVYIFELDSVRKSDEEIKIAKEKLYMELMRGNNVILSLNQLDSIVMFDLLDVAQEQYTREPILQLINDGRIGVSEYKERTIVSYLSEPMKEPKDGKPYKKFTYSGLYFLNRFDYTSDLYKEIYEIFHNEKNLKYLEAKGLDEREKGILYDYILVMKNVSDLICRFSAIDSNKTLEKVIKLLIEAAHNCLPEKTSLVDSADKILQQTENRIKKGNRSDWITDINEHNKRDSKEAVQAIEFARAIVDVAYNYVVELSMPLVTEKHSLSNQVLMAKEVEDYFEIHDFEIADSNKVVNKEHRLLHWRAVSEFSSKVKQIIQTESDWEKHLKKRLALEFLLTCAMLAFIAFCFLADQILIGISSIVLMVISSFLPSSPVDGFKILFRLFRLSKVYYLYKRDRCAYIETMNKRRFFTRDKV